MMKALVKSKREPGLWLEEVPDPVIGINDLLIRVLRTGICGTDLHIYDWDAGRSAPFPPLVSAMSSWARWSRSAPMSTTSTPATLSAAKDTWCAGAAATVWPGGAISARIPGGSASIVPARSPNISLYR